MVGHGPVDAADIRQCSSWVIRGLPNQGRRACLSAVSSTRWPIADVR